MKQIIKLTESDLHRIVKESVNKALNKSNSVFYGDRPSKITKVDRSNSSNKHTMSPDEIEKIHNIVSEVSVAPNGYKHRFDPNKRDGDFPIEQPEWTKDPRWQGWKGEDPEWIMKQQEKYPYGGESKQSVKVSEAQLHQIVKESVEQALSEGFFNKFRRTANAGDAYKGLDGDYSYSKDNDRFYYHDKYGNKHDTGIGYGKGNVGMNWNPLKWWNSTDRQVTQKDLNNTSQRLGDWNNDYKKTIDRTGKRAYDKEQERKQEELWRKKQEQERKESEWKKSQRKMQSDPKQAMRDYNTDLTIQNQRAYDAGLR